MTTNSVQSSGPLLPMEFELKKRTPNDRVKELEGDLSVAKLQLKRIDEALPDFYQNPFITASEARRVLSNIAVILRAHMAGEVVIQGTGLLEQLPEHIDLDALERRVGLAPPAPPNPAQKIPHEMNKMQKQVYDVLAASRDGMTKSALRLECDARYGQRDESAWRKRLLMLERMGYVVRTNQMRDRSDRPSMRKEYVWKAVMHEDGDAKKDTGLEAE